MFMSARGLSSAPRVSFERVMELADELSAALSKLTAEKEIK